jgi:hypothetical protein
MNTLHAHAADGEISAGLSAAVLVAPEDLWAAGAQPRYCPTGLLAGFALLMAGHGRCVNTDMMLGDREYAMWQLACARATDDTELAQVAARLSPYFDDPLHSATPMLGTA